jgi:hypothetical protein
MKLLRVGPAGQERPAARSTAYDLRPLTTGIDGAFLGGVSRVRTALDDGVPAVLDNDLPGQA